MGILPVYSNVVWTQECPCYLLAGSCRSVQGIHPQISKSVFRWLDCLRLSKDARFEPTHDVGRLLETPDFPKYQEMYILRTLWNLARPYSFLTRIDGGPYEICSYHQSGSAYDWKIAVFDPRTYGLLQKIHSGIRTDHNTFGKFA